MKNKKAHFNFVSDDELSLETEDNTLLIEAYRDPAARKLRIRTYEEGKGTEVLVLTPNLENLARSYGFFGHLNDILFYHND